MFNKIINKIKNEITHTIITVSGKRIKCYDSLELYDFNENKLIVAYAKIKGKRKLVTIKDQNVDYMIENFNWDVWNELVALTQMTDSDGEKKENKDYV